MTFVCDACGATSPGRGQRTETGRRLDQECWDQLQGLTAGVIATGGDSSRVVTGRWYAALRGQRRRVVAAAWLRSRRHRQRD